MVETSPGGRDQSGKKRTFELVSHIYLEKLGAIGSSVVDHLGLPSTLYCTYDASMEGGGCMSLTQAWRGCVSDANRERVCSVCLRRKQCGGVYISDTSREGGVCTNDASREGVCMSLTQVGKVVYVSPTEAGRGCICV